jgi:hypothetical protein
LFVVQNKNLFSTNIENYNIDTKQRNNVYLPQANLTIYQKEAYLGIKILIINPWKLRMLLATKRKFKIALKKCLYSYSFYTTEEYLSQS